MTMTIRALIERLEEQADAHGDDAEVRLMTQESWPFENSIIGVCSGDDINRHQPQDEPDADDEDVCHDTTIYLVEGGQLGYGSKRAWEVCN